MKTKKINYSKVLHSSIQRFLARPGEFSAKIGIKLTTGAYPEKEAVGPSIVEAMALWLCIAPDSQFYEKIQERLREKKNFDWRQFNNARDTQVQALLSKLSTLEETSENCWVRAVCRFMLLPKDVVRKWLWHENVDFQSCESFLRRLTNEQHVSLKKHWELVKAGAETNKLPCFNEGMLNKVWNFFGLAAKEEPNRMATKSAIAHDFLGMGMGFALYPDTTDDRTVDQKLAAQFLAKKQDRGQFEVNKEHGGLYWFLYRTLRSNSLYREGRHVELGRWVCPGFWFTMIMWGILTLVSPSSLIAAASLYVLKGVTSWVLIGLGVIAPIVASLVWVKKLCSKEYDDEYWRWFLVSFACLLGVNLAHMALLHAKDYWSVGVGILCLMFLVPYCIKKETAEFWHAPILGKLLPLMFLSAGAWDIYVHSNFWQECVSFFLWLAQSAWSFLQSVALSIYEMRYLIMWGIIGVLMYAALAFGLIYVSGWAAKKFDEMIERGDKRVYSYERWLTAIPFAVVSVLLLYAANPTHHSSGSEWAMIGLITLPFLVFLVVREGNRVDVVVNKKVSQSALRYLSMGDEDRSAIRRALACNKFWADVDHAVARGKVLNGILSEIRGHYRSRFVWIVALTRAVKNDVELTNIEKFASSEMYDELRFGVDGVDHDVLSLILSGASEEDIGRAIESAREKYFAARQKPEKPSRWVVLMEQTAEWIDGKFVPFLKACFMFITWPLRMLWKMVCDLYALWEAFNEQCPQSPPRDRPVAQ